MKKNIFEGFVYGYINNMATNVLFFDCKEYSVLKKTKQSIAKEQLLFYGINKKLANSVIPIATSIELPLSLLIIFWHFVKALLVWVFTPKQAIKCKQLSLKLNMPEARVINLYKSADIVDYLWVDISGQSQKYNGKDKVSVFSGLKLIDILRSFFISIQLCFYMQKKFGKNDTLFRYYASFDYALAYFFFKNLDKSNSIVYYNTFDRWSYMLMRFPFEVTWVQHGKLTNKIRYKRYKGVKTAFYINKAQQDICETFLFSDKPIAKYRKLFDYSAKEKMIRNGNKHVLFICFFGALKNTEETIARLEGKNLNIYIKPHPSEAIQMYDGIKAKYPNLVFLGKYDYPEVDYVISYDSTLADEYEMHDIPVFKYEDDNFEDKITLLV